MTRHARRSAMRMGRLISSAWFKTSLRGCIRAGLRTPLTSMIAAGAALDSSTVLLACSRGEKSVEPAGSNATLCACRRSDIRASTSRSCGACRRYSVARKVGSAIKRSTSSLRQRVFGIQRQQRLRAPTWRSPSATGYSTRSLRSKVGMDAVTPFWRLLPKRWRPSVSTIHRRNSTRCAPRSTCRWPSPATRSTIPASCVPSRRPKPSAKRGVGRCSCAASLSTGSARPPAALLRIRDRRR